MDSSSSSQDFSAAVPSWDDGDPGSLMPFSFSLNHKSTIPVHASEADDDNEEEGNEEANMDGTSSSLPISIHPLDITRPCDFSKATHELLLESVDNFWIGFDLSTFPQFIASWIPRLRHAALPGSYEQLLLLLYDDLAHYVQLQKSMADGIPNYLTTHRDRVLYEDRLRNVGRAYEWSHPRYRKPATLHARRPSSLTRKNAEESLFFAELRMLRDLVAPVRDASLPVYWITLRKDRADDMEPEFAASQDIIARFKIHLQESLYDHHKNYTIHCTRSSTADPRKDLSLKQFRLDTCKGTLLWEKYPPDPMHFTDFHQHYRDHLLQTDPFAAQEAGFLPPISTPPPTVKVAYQPGVDLGDRWAPVTYESKILTLLVRTAQWLALARGLPAVHLFYDVTRLFTIYGVDVANATQIGFCNLMASLRFPRDAHVQPPARPPLTPSGGIHNPEYFRDLEAANRAMVQALINEDTLLGRDDDAISWDFPHQTLAWSADGCERKLVLKRPFQRCRFNPVHVVDTEWEDFIAAHLEKGQPEEDEDFDNLDGGVPIVGFSIAANHYSEVDYESSPKTPDYHSAVTSPIIIPSSVKASTPAAPPNLDPILEDEELSAWLDANSGSPTFSRSYHALHLTNSCPSAGPRTDN
ncbi:hypothetical protein N7474_009081 [Penicillium riverlandense]|uniref:uncharacterized protein n=1 Tax=Penicillium riverlandense TaxID=1903569 RepID=UPI00254940A0|nr:uncharacterized protein N7474_009081 [Penicillium riverlandense]KAJ5807812.1 hypothetical protein N7474_009081 [Penicillium riverlandense]